MYIIYRKNIIYICLDPVICAGQTGLAHPQAPNCPKAKMYKVLREISEEVNQGQKGESVLTVGGRVRNPQLKTMLAQQLGQGLESLEGAALVDLKTGRITSKKSKKAKTPLQLALDELKKVHAKFLAITLVQKKTCALVGVTLSNNM